MKKVFHCDKCGACCRNIELFGNAYAWLVDKKTGRCRYFVPETSLCAIYPIRPLICNIEMGYLLFFSDMKYEEFIAQNQKACEFLKTLPHAQS